VIHITRDGAGRCVYFNPKDATHDTLPRELQDVADEIYRETGRVCVLLPPSLDLFFPFSISRGVWMIVASAGIYGY